MNDLVVRRARIVDGTGAPWFRGDVAVLEGRFVEIGDAGGGHLEIDADDRVLAPGFIDMHSHNDLQLLVDPENAMKVAQGVTTEVLGQDGLSCAPLLPGQEERIAELLAPIDGVANAFSWRTVAEYLDRLDRSCAVNTAYLAPHGSIRAQVLSGEDRAAEPSEVAQVRSLVAQAMSDGAFGMSTGLEYVPSRNTTFDELLELMKTVASAGGMYVTHVRDYDRFYTTAIEEAVAIGSQSHAPIHLSHFVAWGRRHHGSMPKLLEVLESARSRGVDTMFDVYPYEAGSSYATYFFPDEVRMLPPDELRARLRDPERRRQVAAQIDRGPGPVELGWEYFFVAEGDEMIGADGRSLAEIAKQQGRSVGEICCELLERTDLRASMIVHASVDEDVQTAITHRLATICSDGIPVGDRPHPRGWGAFARIIREYVVEKRLLTLEAALTAMSGRAAARLGLRDRGLVREGLAADFVLFEPTAVKDNATYQRPRELARGFDLVVVNGQPVWQDDASTGHLPGVALRRLAPRSPSRGRLKEQPKSQAAPA